MLRGELQDHPAFKDLRLIIIGDEIARHPALRHAVIQSRVEDVRSLSGLRADRNIAGLLSNRLGFCVSIAYTRALGLPPLEAMACGTPVVCSNVSSLPEVVGEAAVIVNPENVFDIARGMREVLLDEALRGRLIAEGIEKARQFSWERTAAEVLQAYEEIASYKNRPR